MGRYVVEMPIVGRVRVVVDTDIAEVDDTASAARALVAETLSSTERTLVALADEDVAVLRLKSDRQPTGGVMKREKVAVTPPGNDTPQMRAWLADMARCRGWTQLEWERVDGMSVLWAQRAATTTNQQEG